VLSPAGGYLSPASDPAPEPGEQRSLPAAGPASGQVELHDIKYDRLVKKVKELRGSIVVVDVWATWCAPCKREFPGLVQLNQKHGKDGVVCLSVSVDEKDASGAALKFLRTRQATFWNYRLDEDEKVWQERWNVDVIPLVMVFDRTGQRVAKFPIEKNKPFTYTDVEKVVGELLTRPR
jgi:thiol-disulfide isomerase/thioredoxin